MTFRGGGNWSNMIRSIFAKSPLSLPLSAIITITINENCDYCDGDGSWTNFWGRSRDVQREEQRETGSAY